MTDNLSNFAENKTLDHLTGAATFTITGPLKLALLTNVPDDETAGIEVTGGGYARQTIAFDPAVDGSTANSAEIEFTDMPETDVAGFALYDSSGSPQLLWHGEVNVAMYVYEGDSLYVSQGSLVLSLA